jgi:DNA-binding Lrp family transcriptional regulator
MMCHRRINDTVTTDSYFNCVAYNFERSIVIESKPNKTQSLDDLDKKLIQYLSVGTGSYEELARLCNVTRNTVYRRIAALENKGIIKNTIGCIINLDQLNISPVCIEARIAQSEQGNALNLLASHLNVRMLWRTYGDYDLHLVAFCQKGSEGQTIQGVRTLLEELNATNISVSIGFVWEKMDLTPFGDRTKIKNNLTEIIENKN